MRQEPRRAPCQRTQSICTPRTCPAPPSERFPHDGLRSNVRRWSSSRLGLVRTRSTPSFRRTPYRRTATAPERRGRARCGTTPLFEVGTPQPGHHAPITSFCSSRRGGGPQGSPKKNKRSRQQVFSSRWRRRGDATRESRSRG